jgi:hypothetical protein
MPLLHHRGTIRTQDRVLSTRPPAPGELGPTVNANGAQRRSPLGRSRLEFASLGPTSAPTARSAEAPALDLGPRLAECPGKESRLPFQLRRLACICYTTGTCPYPGHRNPCGCSPPLCLGTGYCVLGTDFGQGPRTCTRPMPASETGGALPPHVPGN